MELMRLLFGTKDPQPAVSERETWIILLSRKLKKENENTEERLAGSTPLNCILFSVPMQQECQFYISTVLQTQHHCASVTKTKSI